MGKFLWRLLLILLAVLVIWLGFALLTGRGVSLFGYTLLTVEGTDMDPTLPEGSLLLARQLREDLRIKLGDIITYRRDGETATRTQRVVEVTIGPEGSERYRTQGDHPLAVPEAEAVRRDEVVGVYRRRLR